MRFLVVSDFQGKFPEKLKRRLKKEEYDFIIGLGDYATIDDWRPYTMKMFAELKAGKERTSMEKFFGGKKRVRELRRKDDLATRRVLKELDSLGKPIISIWVLVLIG